MSTTQLTLAEVAELVVRHGAQGYMSGGKSRIEFTDDQLMAFAADLIERGRKAAARDIRAVRDTRAADACCKGTGECGIDDCRVDSARDDAFTDAADIAEKGTIR